MRREEWVVLMSLIHQRPLSFPTFHEMSGSEGRLRGRYNLFCAIGHYVEGFGLSSIFDFASEPAHGESRSLHNDSQVKYRMRVPLLREGM